MTGSQKKLWQKSQCLHHAQTQAATAAASSLHICVTAGVCGRVWLPKVCVCVCAHGDALQTQTPLKISSPVISLFSFSVQHLRRDALTKRGHRRAPSTWAHTSRPIRRSQMEWILPLQSLLNNLRERVREAIWTNWEKCWGKYRSPALACLQERISEPGLCSWSPPPCSC